MEFLHFTIIIHFNYNQYWTYCLFVGGPGSGRGTQCELIQTKTGYTHVSTGDVLRHEVMSGSQRGLKFYKLMSEGNAIPDDDIAELVRDVMMAKIIGSKVISLD